MQSSEYDTSGRLIRVVGTDDKYITRYDSAGNVIEARNSLGNFSYSYNDRNLVDAMTETINGTAFSFSYSFDATGAVTGVTYPDSSVITYQYDDYGRLDRVLSGNDELISFTYNKDDSVAAKSECDGNSTMSYNYNFRGWITRISAYDGNGTFMDLRYSYDDVGNVVRIVDAVGSAGTEQYEYDMLGRLTKATGVWGTLRYGYDSMGNRLWMNDGTNRSYSYSSYNKLTSDGTFSYAYDNDGNVIWKNSTAGRFHFEYNSFGQMISVEKQTNNSGIWSPLTALASYAYDANSARAIVSDSEGVVTSVYQGHDPAYEVADGNVSKFVYVNSRLELRLEGDDSYAYLADALGSSRFVLRNGVHDVASVSYYALTYEPFGEVVGSEGFDRLTFASEVRDSTGLVYLGARYYDPELGRFTALDPLTGNNSNPQTLNRFVYCVNSPLIHTDPTGQILNFIAQIAGGAIIGAVVGAVLAGASSNWNTNAMIAGAAGGAISGAVAGATFGMGSTVSIGLSAAEVGAISGGVQGTIESGLNSNWNVEETVKGGLFGALLGGATGYIGGSSMSKFVSKTKVFDRFANVAEKKIATATTKMWVDDVGVRMFEGKTAKVAGTALGLSAQITTVGGYNAMIKTGIKLTATTIYDSPQLKGLRTNANHATMYWGA